MLKYQYLVNTQADEKGRWVKFFDGYRAGHELTLAREGEVCCPDPYRTSNNNSSPVLGAIAYSSNTDITILEMLYYLFNSDRAYETFGYRGPSMSIGDIVILNPGPEQKVYVCAVCGFQEVGDFDGSNIKQCPAKWYSTEGVEAR